jgi:hypothetical protein
MEDRFLVRKVMIEIAGGHAGPIRDIADARGLESLMRKELKRRIEDRPATPLGLFLSLHLKMVPAEAG